MPILHKTSDSKFVSIVILFAISGLSPRDKPPIAMPKAADDHVISGLWQKWVYVNYGKRQEFC